MLLITITEIKVFGNVFDLKQVLCFGLQLHIVHIKEPYGSLAEAEHDMAGIALLAFLFEVTHLNEFVVMAAFSLVTTQTDADVFTGNDRGSSSFEHSDRCFGTSAEQRYELGCFKIQ